MSIKRAVVLILCTAFIVLCAVRVGQVESSLQYLVSAPTAGAKTDSDDTSGDSESQEETKKAEDSGLKKALKSLDTLSEGWDGIISAYGVSAETSSVSLGGVNGRTQSARLTALYGNAEALPKKYLIAGRLMYPEELTGSGHVIVLDEQLAIALFRVGDPVGREVTLGESSYTVVGIVRHTRAPGDAEAYAAYVPLLTLDEDAVQSTLLTVWATPIPGAGAASKFKSDMDGWLAGGDYYSLSKERFRAMLPLRALLSVLGFLLILNGFRALAALGRHLTADFRERLGHIFIYQLTPRLIGYLLLGLGCFAGLLAACYFVTKFTLEAVYIFPEWIPAVPVDWNDIVSTFWANQTDTGKLIELRSSQLLTLRFYRYVLSGLCALTGCIALNSYGALRPALKKRWEKEKKTEAE